MPNDPIGFFPNPFTGSGTDSDENVKVSDDDTTADHLDDKIVAGSGIILTVLNDGGNEQLQITSTGGGGSDDEEIIANFDYTTSSPANIVIVNPEGTVTTTRVIVDTVFDGTATMSVGTTIDNDALMATDEIDLTELASYEVSPDLTLAATTQTQLTLNLSGTTQGAGRVILKITR